MTCVQCLVIWYTMASYFAFVIFVERLQETLFEFNVGMSIKVKFVVGIEFF
jgi:hypothetical protein